MRYPLIDQHGRPRTPYAVHCEGPWDLPGGGHGLVYLTRKEYDHQMSRPDTTWRCPICKYEAPWDDTNYETFGPEEAS
jgi:hypothetical protein